MEAHTFTRIVAFFVDLIILSLILSLLTFWIPTSKSYEEAIENEDTIITSYRKGDITPEEFFNKYFENSYVKDKEKVIISVVSIILSLGYFGTFAYYNDGQTLGKKMLKIKVVDLDNKKASHLSLMLRTLIVNGVLVSILSCIIIMLITKYDYFYTIGLLQVIQTIIMISSLFMVAFRNDKKGIHDLLAKTKVIES